MGRQSLVYIGQALINRVGIPHVKLLGCRRDRCPMQLVRVSSLIVLWNTLLAIEGQRRVWSMPRKQTYNCHHSSHILLNAFYTVVNAISRIHRLQPHMLDEEVKLFLVMCW